MPTYEYECNSCQHRFEENQSFSSEPVATCPKCTEDSRRVFHAVPVVFKGAGFYVNDYGKGSGAGTSSDTDLSKNNKEDITTDDKKTKDSSNTSNTATNDTETKVKTTSKSPKTESKSQTTTPKSE